MLYSPATIIPNGLKRVVVEIIHWDPSARADILLRFCQSYNWVHFPSSSPFPDSHTHTHTKTTIHIHIHAITHVDTRVQLHTQPLVVSVDF